MIEPPRRPGLISVPLLLAALAVHTQPARAQSPWGAEVAAGASLFFGNTRQYTINTRVEIERADSVAEVSAAGDFFYGEASTEEGDSFINKRSWSLGASADLRPLATLSPFFFGSVESSLQARIDTRLSGGAGAKLSLVQRSDARVDLSAALLAERTNPRSDTGTADEVETLARWAFRLRASRDLADERVSLATRTFFRPRFSDWSVYTFELVASLDLAITDHLGLRLALIDKYDSEAGERGARSNNDGQFIVALTAEF